MSVYTFLTIPIAILAGILLACRTKRAEGVRYHALDHAGRVTNILLIPLYACILPISLLLGLISEPAHDGVLGILGWIVSILVASPALFCGVGLGASVALRKRGASTASFAVQFLGMVAIVISFVLYFSLEGSLLRLLN